MFSFNYVSSRHNIGSISSTAHEKRKRIRLAAVDVFPFFDMVLFSTEYLCPHSPLPRPGHPAEDGVSLYRGARSNMTEVVHEFRKFGFSIVIRVNHLPSVAASQKNIKGEYERKRNAKMRMERVQRPPPDTAPTVIHHGEEGLCLDLYIRVELRSPGISLDILKGFFSTAVYKVEWCFPIVVSADPAATDPKQVQDVASFLVDTFAVSMNARDSQGGLFFNYKDDMELVFSSALYEAHR